MSWSRRQVILALGCAGSAVLPGCQSISGSTEPERHLVELRNYADRSARFVIRVDGEDGDKLWEYEDELDGGTAVNEFFEGTPEQLDISVGDWEERPVTWEAVDCGDRSRASTAAVVYGANTDMDATGTDFRCEDIDAKDPERE